MNGLSWCGGVLGVCMMALVAGCSSSEEPKPSADPEVVEDNDTEAPPCENGDPRVFFADLDGDGFGDVDAPITACEAPANHVDDARDCDDASNSVFPGAPEVCDGVDQDCDNAIDEEVMLPFWPDRDEDQFGDLSAEPVFACEAPVGHVAENTDCDDDATGVHPGAIELCDAIDNNCTDGTDEGLLIAAYPDADEDGFGDDSAEPLMVCEVPIGAVANNDDCADADPNRHPEAFTQLCDLVDTDCDGALEEIRVPQDRATLSQGMQAAGSGGAVCLDTGTYEVPVVMIANRLVEGVGDGPSVITTLPGSAFNLQGQSGGTVTLRSVTLSGGSRDMWGALVQLSGTVRLEDVVIEDMTCTGNCQGGAIAVGPTTNLTWVGGALRDNTIVLTENGSGSGAGVHVADGGTLSMEGVDVHGNQILGLNDTGYGNGAGIYSLGNVSLNGVRVYDNHIHGTSGGSGAGTMLWSPDSTPSITDSLFSGNTIEAVADAGGAGLALSAGGADLSHVTIAGNRAEAVAVRGAGLNMGRDWVALDHVTVVDNESVASSFSYGAGLYRSNNDFGLTNSIVQDNIGGAGFYVGSPSLPFSVSTTSAYGQTPNWENVPMPSGMLSADAQFADRSDPSPWLWDLTVSPTSPLATAAEDGGAIGAR